MTEKEYILTHILNCSRTDLYLGSFTKNNDFDTELSRILARRRNGEPVQYITGTAEFMGLTFKVDRRVLVPRPETEILVEEAIKIVRSSKFVVRSVLDLGTGSGNIAISLAKFLPECKVTAIDTFSDAIRLAEENAALNNIAGKIEFIVSDLFNSIRKDEPFDMIISNPPYVATQEMAGLSAEVRHEPRLALDGGRDGLDFYRRMVKKSPAYLKKGGIFLAEMGYNQSNSIQDIFCQSGNFKIQRIVCDYRNIERVIVAKRI